MHLAQSLASLQLVPSSGTPMFRQLYDAIKQSVLSDKIGPGAQLPPTRDLARQLGISRQTVLNAYEHLMAEGYLSGAVGRGTFVSETLPLPRSRKRPPSGQAVGPLRPLSPRGQRFIGPQTALNIHEGRTKAFRIGMPGLDLFPFDVWGRLAPCPA